MHEDSEKRATWRSCWITRASHKRLTFLGLGLSAVSMLMSLAPYICIWLAARDLIAVAPDWTAGAERGPLRLAGLCLCHGRHRSSILRA